MTRFVKITVPGGNFEIPERYTGLEVVKIGVSGIVCSSWDQIGQKDVAVKRILEPFRSPSTAQYILREIKLLIHFNHENIIRPLDIFISPAEDVYLVTDFMQTDLRALLQLKSIGPEFVQFFLYQIMRGLRYIHSAGVIHRDLEPQNILINRNCDLKICNFGLAPAQEPQMTGYVSTRYYQAPEIILLSPRYDEKVDIWSVGCIFAEMLQGRPLLAGRDNVDQFVAMTKLLGTPTQDILARMASDSAVCFLQTLPHREGVGLSRILPNADATARELIERMVVFDPSGRISASDALHSPYLSSYHDPTDEPVAEKTFDWTVNEAYYPEDVWKQKLYAEVLEFHKQEEFRESVKRWAQTTSIGQP